MENLESRLWKILPSILPKAPRKIKGTAIVKWVREKHADAMEQFKDHRILHAISLLASKHSTSPVQSWADQGTRGYSLRGSFSTEPPAFTDRRGRRASDGSHHERAPRQRVSIDLAGLWKKLARNPSQARSVLDEHKELKIAVTEKGLHRVILELRTAPEPQPSLPERSYLAGSFAPKSRGTHVLVFDQRGESGDGFFVPLFTEVFEELATTPRQERLSAEQFVEIVESELKRKERKKSKNLLTDEEERGLIGELWFLADILMEDLSISPQAAVEAWHGPKASPKDYWFDRGCIEIKTSLANAKVVEISSMQQLDCEGLQNLFLLHLRLDQHQGRAGAAKTLPQYVRAVREKIGNDRKALDLFEDRLWRSQDLGNGKQCRRYRDRDKREYKDRYYVRGNERSYFKVKGNPTFPRLSRKELEDRGVEISSYSIVLARCGPLIEQPKVFRALSILK